MSCHTHIHKQLFLRCISCSSIRSDSLSARHARRDVLEGENVSQVKVREHIFHPITTLDYRAGCATYLNVCHAMVVEIRTGRKAFPTHLALVGLLAGVDASMCVQRTGRAEALPADQTHVRFFTCLLRMIMILVIGE